MSARSLIVVGAAGGCGASLLAGGLALAWVRSGRDPLLVDLDLERGDLADRWDLPRERTLGDLVAVAQEVDARQLERASVRNAAGVRVSAQGDVVFDAPGAGAPTRAAIGVCRAVVMVCPATLAGVGRAARLLEDARADGWDDRVAFVLALGRRSQVSERAFGRALGASVIASLPWSEHEAREMAGGRWPTGRKRPLTDAIRELGEVIL
ncbi:MAG TPA: hypothetical protein PKE32_07725 [Miltoncostaeaceae bacterium]|nr:hypothetical protein [Miltoncostaeaceae bacterium]